MAATMTVTVELSPEQTALVREQVESGRYSDPEEVMGAALHLFDERVRLERLRALLQVGQEEHDRGEFVEFTPELMEVLKREAEAASLAGEPIPDEVKP